MINYCEAPVVKSENSGCAFASKLCDIVIVIPAISHALTYNKNFFYKNSFINDRKALMTEV